MDEPGNAKNKNSDRDMTVKELEDIIKKTKLKSQQ